MSRTYSSTVRLLAAVLPHRQHGSKRSAITPDLREHQPQHAGADKVINSGTVVQSCLPNTTLTSGKTQPTTVYIMCVRLCLHAGLCISNALGRMGLGTSVLCQLPNNFCSKWHIGKAYMSHSCEDP